MLSLVECAVANAIEGAIVLVGTTVLDGLAQGAIAVLALIERVASAALAVVEVVVVAVSARRRELDDFLLGHGGHL